MVVIETFIPFCGKQPREKGVFLPPSQCYQKLTGLPLKSTASEEITSSLVSVRASKICSRSLPLLATFSIPIITSLDIITKESVSLVGSILGLTL